MIEDWIYRGELNADLHNNEFFIIQKEQSKNVSNHFKEWILSFQVRNNFYLVKWKNIQIKSTLTNLKYFTLFFLCLEKRNSAILIY
jgi:hypothetical protein